MAPRAPSMVPKKAADTSPTVSRKMSGATPGSRGSGLADLRLAERRGLGKAKDGTSEALRGPTGKAASTDPAARVAPVTAQGLGRASGLGPATGRRPAVGSATGKRDVQLADGSKVKPSVQDGYKDNITNAMSTHQPYPKTMSASDRKRAEVKRKRMMKPKAKPKLTPQGKPGNAMKGGVSNAVQQVGGSANQNESGVPGGS